MQILVIPTKKLSTYSPHYAQIFQIFKKWSKVMKDNGRLEPPLFIASLHCASAATAPNFANLPYVNRIANLALHHSAISTFDSVETKNV